MPALEGLAHGPTLWVVFLVDRGFPLLFLSPFVDDIYPSNLFSALNRSDGPEASARTELVW